MNDQNPEIKAGKARADGEIARWADDQTNWLELSIDNLPTWIEHGSLVHDFESDARRLRRKIDRSIKASAKEAYDAVVAKIVELEGPDAIKSMPAYNCTMTEAGQEPVALNLIEGVQMVGPNEVFVVLLESLGLRFLGEGIRLRPEDTAEGHARSLIAAAALDEETRTAERQREETRRKQSWRQPEGDGPFFTSVEADRAGLVTVT